MDGEPKGARVEMCSIIRALAIQHVGASQHVGMAVNHPLRDRRGRLCVDHDGERLTTDALRNDAELERGLASSQRPRPAASQQVQLHLAGVMPKAWI
jgi:hypothetical protein